MNPSVRQVIPADDYKLVLVFTNGEQGIYDCSPLLNFGVFKELNDLNYFKQVQVVGGTVAWPHEQDICPDTLYLDSNKDSSVQESDREVLATKAAFLCCHFARNYAYYAVFKRSKLLHEEGFWLTVQGNFVDVCVLEWSKLFGNTNGKYHWKNVVRDPSAFKSKMFDRHRLDQNKFHELWLKVKNYRDDFVAHLEEQETTVTPSLSVPYLLVGFYFRELQSDFPMLRTNNELPEHFDRYCKRCREQAEKVLQSIS